MNPLQELAEYEEPDEPGGFEQRGRPSPHRWRLVDGVLASLTLPGTVPEQTWRSYLDVLAERRPKHCLLLSVGAVTIDAGQRRRFTNAAMRARSASVVLTDNRITRGWAMAVAWFGAKLDAYAWQDLPQALDSLEVGGATRRRLYETALSFHEAESHLER
ncbi:MAG: hypothetical protein AAF799_18135 [Myxococcota bacterium]